MFLIPFILSILFILSKLFSFGFLPLSLSLPQRPDVDTS